MLETRYAELEWSSVSNQLMWTSSFQSWLLAQAKDAIDISDIGHGTKMCRVVDFKLFSTLNAIAERSEGREARVER